MWPGYCLLLRPLLILRLVLWCSFSINISSRQWAFWNINCRYDARKSILEWSILLIDNSNRRLIGTAFFLLSFQSDSIVFLIWFIIFMLCLQWIYGICYSCNRYIRSFPNFCALYFYKNFQWSKGSLLYHTLHLLDLLMSIFHERE